MYHFHVFLNILNIARRLLFNFRSRRSGHIHLYVCICTSPHMRWIVCLCYAFWAHLEAKWEHERVCNWLNALNSSAAVCWFQWMFVSCLCSRKQWAADVPFDEYACLRQIELLFGFSELFWLYLQEWHHNCTTTPFLPRIYMFSAIKFMKSNNFYNHAAIRQHLQNSCKVITTEFRMWIRARNILHSKHVAFLCWCSLHRRWMQHDG